MENYDIVTTLGHGTGGDVYLVRSATHKKLLALKKIQLDDKKKTRTKDAVLREAKILSDLKHPHIVTYYESFFDAKELHLCIVQDYCDGGSLDERIHLASMKHECIEEKQIMQWFIQIAMAVQYIHSKKVLHRDLKTQNVFLTKKEVVKLGDFGIARTLDYTIDKASTCVGTPCYLSPELCQDIPYNNKSDMWALGCLLYEMCGLQPAFDANNLISLFYKIVKCDHADVPDMYSDELKELVNAILVKEPDKRPSATAILSMPFVQKHINSFIEQRQVWKQEILQNKKPSRPQSREGQEGSSDQGLKSSDDTAKLPDMLLSTDKLTKPALDSANNSNNNSYANSPETSRRLEPRDSGEYSDDFTSSDEENIEEVCESSEEEIPEEVPEVGVDDDDNDDDDDDDDDDDNPRMHATKLPYNALHGAKKEKPVIQVEHETDYPDDFEEVESDEDLDVIITHAKTAVGIDANDDDDDSELEDEDFIRPGSSCRQLLREHCIDSLGKDVFDKVQKQCKEGISALDLQPKFALMAGSDHMETCYLVNEILAEEDDT
ncbi:serine/threonine-protein kinase Nek1-like [Glandiceps talaboti]